MWKAAVFSSLLHPQLIFTWLIPSATFSCRSVKPTNLRDEQVVVTVYYGTTLLTLLAAKKCCIGSLRSQEAHCN
jgi:hypothetical protein